jgi:hypothetical protein
VTTTKTTSSTATTSAATAHQAFKVFLVLLLFVMLATLLAGLDDAWGKAMIALMIAFLVLQGITHGAELANFVNKLDLAPPTTTKAKPVSFNFATAL